MGNKIAKANYQDDAFIAAYLGEARFNATEAERMTGAKHESYDALRVAGSARLAKPHVKSAIEDALRAQHVSAAEALAITAQFARASYKPFLTEDGQIDLSSDEARRNVHLIKSMKVRERRSTDDKGRDYEDIETEVTIHDAADAAKTLLKVHKLLSDRVAVDVGEETRQLLASLRAPAAETIDGVAVDVTDAERTRSEDDEPVSSPD